MLILLFTCFESGPERPTEATTSRPATVDAHSQTEVRGTSSERSRNSRICPADQRQDSRPSTSAPPMLGTTPGEFDSIIPVEVQVVLQSLVGRLVRSRRITLTYAD